MKLRAGRFQKETDDKVNDFNSSISFDARLYRQDITGSIAHATMLGEQGIIAKEEAEKIVTTLKTLLEEIKEGKVEFTKDSEDIHMNMEVLLTSESEPQASGCTPPAAGMIRWPWTSASLSRMRFPSLWGCCWTWRKPFSARPRAT